MIFRLTPSARRAGLLLVGGALLFLFGCVPQEPQPSLQEQVSARDWVLIGGRVYVDNLDLDLHVGYDYFDDQTNTASMSLFDTSLVLMDQLDRYGTTWRFEEPSFDLDGEHSFNLSSYSNGFGQLVLSVNGLHGGTARPIVLQDLDDHHMLVTVRESYNSDEVYNYHYVSELLFKEGQGSLKVDTALREGYRYNGRWIHKLPDPMYDLTGTTWVLTRYNNGLSGNVYPNDTLQFISLSDYSVNGGLPRSYALNGLVGTPRLSLTLYGMPALGGDVMGQLLPSFIEDGEVSNAEFHDLFEVANTVTVWMERLD